MVRKVAVFLCVTTIITSMFSFGERVYASQNLVKPERITDHDSVLVDGINQSYLDYREITKDELIKELKSVDYNDDVVLKSIFQSNDLGFLNFGDIVKNPGKYFKVSANIGIPYSSVKVGLNFEKLNDSLKYLNYPIKDTNYNKIHINNLKLKKVDLESLYFTAEIRVRKYEKFLGKMVKLLDRTASADIKLDYYFDSKDNSLNFKKLETSNISMERKVLDVILGTPEIWLIREVLEKIIEHDVAINEKIKLSFLDPRYFKTPQLYTEGCFLYMNFNIDSVNVVRYLLRNLGILGVSTNVVDTQINTISKELAERRVLMERTTEQTNNTSAVHRNGTTELIKVLPAR